MTALGQEIKRALAESDRKWAARDEPPACADEQEVGIAGWTEQKPPGAVDGEPPAGAGGQETIRIVEPAEGKDAADHFAAGYGVGDFMPVQAAGGGDPVLRFVTVQAFAAVDELGSGPILGDGVIVQGGDLMQYGTGGAGKTTLQIDAACHLAAGDDWLGWTVNSPQRVAIIENEGPRGMFRKKLAGKLTGWGGSDIADRLAVLDEPWAEVRLNDPGWFQALAVWVTAWRPDVLMIGPITAAGMDEAGTIQQTRAFHGLIREMREGSGVPFASWLTHHDNRAGTVSGAWEGVCDTILRVSSHGNGQTGVHIQKARWSSEWHGRTLNLAWADGGGFDVKDRPVLGDAEVGALMDDYIRDHPGTGWGAVEKAARGIQADRRRKIRDQRLEAGQWVHVGRDGQPEKPPSKKGQPYRLHHLEPGETRVRPGTADVLPFRCTPEPTSSNESRVRPDPDVPRDVLPGRGGTSHRPDYRDVPPGRTYSPDEDDDPSQTDWRK